MNFKIICLALISIFVISCDEDTLEPFDYAAQYITEKPVIEEYLRTHYFDNISSEIKTIDASQTALINDENLQTLTTSIIDIDYEMYCYVYEQGIGESPDEDDIINVDFKKTIILSDGSEFEGDTSNDNFLNLSTSSLTDIIEVGLRMGIQVFKGGNSNETDLSLPRQYTGTGKGFMIIPFGLTLTDDRLESGFYSNDDPTEALVFEIELRTVISTGEDL